MSSDAQECSTAVMLWYNTILVLYLKEMDAFASFVSSFEKNGWVGGNSLADAWESFENVYGCLFFYVL